MGEMKDDRRVRLGVVAFFLIVPLCAMVGLWMWTPGAVEAPVAPREAVLDAPPSVPFDPVPLASLDDPESSSPPEAAGVTLSGTLRNPDGEPVAGASIVLSRGTRSSGSLRFDGVAEAESDEEGAFTIPYPAEPSEDRYHYRISAKGYLSFTQDIQGFAAIDPRLDATLYWSSLVSARVVDTENRPVAGAQILYGDDDESTTTDSKGRFRIDADDASSDGFSIQVRHPEFVRERAELSAGLDGQTIMLERGGELRVRVERNGAPLTNVTVGIDGSGGTSQTNGEGVATLTALRRDDSHTVMATIDGERFRGFWSPTLEEGLPHDEYDALIEVPETPQQNITGVVVGNRPFEGAPVPGAIVKLTTLDNFLLGEMRTDAEGRFAISYSPRPQEYRLYLVAISGGTSVSQEIDGTAGGLTQPYALTLTFDVEESTSEPGWTRYLVAEGLGRGRESASRPFERVHLFARSLHAWPPQASLTFRVPADSAVTIAGHYGAGAFAPEEGLLTGMFVPNPTGEDAAAEPGGQELVLRLDSVAARIRGVVLDDDGGPVRGAFVSAYARPKDNVTVIAYGYARTQSNSRGEYELYPLNPTEGYVLLADAPGFEGHSVNVKDELIYPSVQSTPTPVTLKARSAQLSGRVVDADGEPVAEAEVGFMRSPDDLGELETFPNGSFSIALAPGRYTLKASKRGLGETEEVVAVAPAENIELRLPTSDARLRALDLFHDDPELQAAENRLKQFGLIFRMFSGEAWGERYPPPGDIYGAFLPNFQSLYPEYLTDSSLYHVIEGRFGIPHVYTGYALIDEAAGMAYLDAYESLGPEALSWESNAPPTDEGGAELYPLHEGVELNFAPDPNAPGASPLMQSRIPVLFEMPGYHGASGGLVTYMDGHVEFVAYPGKFPMTEAFIERIRAIQANAERP